MGDWEFYRIPGSGTGDALWHWSWRCCRQDGSTAEAAETFKFFLDCVADARLHGYRNGPLMTKREPAFVRPLRAQTPAAAG